MTTPVRRHLVLTPHVTYNVQRKAVRELGARKPRVKARFAARIVTQSERGRTRTLVALKRRVHGISLRTSGPRDVLGAALAFKRFTLPRRQTARIERAASRHQLRIISRAAYRVRFKDARGRTIVRRGRSGTTDLPVDLTPRKFWGASLHRLAPPLRRLIGRVRQWKGLACVTRRSIVDQLRTTYTVLVSGNRSGATALMGAWRADAKRMRTSGLLSGQRAAMLRTRLAAISRRVGGGWSKRLRPSPRWSVLPSCGSEAAAHPKQAGELGAAEIIGKTFKVIHAAGHVIRAGKSIQGLVATLWPDGGNKPATISSIYDLMEADRISYMETTLDNLGALLDTFLQKEGPLTESQPSQAGDEWTGTLKQFEGNQQTFKDAYPQDLLPLFTQYQDSYLALLREGIVMGPKWGFLPNTVAIYDEQLKDVLYSGNTWVDSVYDQGLPSKLGDKIAYQRDMQLQVYDFQDMWKFQDPEVYPYGDPNYRPTRMLYSDLVGYLMSTSTFAAPANVDYPLTSITAWDKYMGSFWFLDAIKADNSPLTGAVTGDTKTTGQKPPAGGKANKIMWPRTDSQGHYYGGPIVDAKGYTNSTSLGTIARLDVTFANGLTDHIGSSPNRPHEFSYPDETLQAVKIMGAYKPDTLFYPNQYVGDSIQFGFRFADSFYPSGEVRLLNAPSNCLDLPSWAVGTVPVIGACTSTPSPAQDWTYDSSSHLLSSSGGPANGGTRCLEAASSDPVAGTAVRTYFCPDTGNLPDQRQPEPTGAQQWIARSDGSISNAKSGLCLGPAGGATSAGTPLQLTTCAGSAAYWTTWTTPWTTPLPGTLRAANVAGNAPPCLEVPGGSRTPGTALQAGDCDGNSDQIWYYDQYTGVGGTRATFELQVYEGTMCMTARGAGAAVVVNDCDAKSSAQKWTVDSDGTIRPMDESGLCLARQHGTTSDVPVQLDTCDGGTGQQWTWPVG